MNPENLLQVLHRTQKCTLGCPVLDRCLGGGVPCNSVTELVAESGCGKTQLCLQLALCAQLPISHGGLSASSLYIYTEFPFPFRRLKQLSHSFSSAHPHLFAGDPCDSVFVHGVQTVDELLDLMPKMESFIADPKTQFPIKLIVIDSIAALFRSEFENTPSDLKLRSAIFFKISARLKSLAKRRGLAVVVTNQVVDFMGPSDGLNALRVGNLGSLFSSGRRVCPALGLAWANCVNSRLFLSRSEEVVGAGSGLVDGEDDGFVQKQTRRWLHVVFAPHLPKSSCEFVITRGGTTGAESR